MLFLVWCHKSCDNSTDVISINIWNSAPFKNLIKEWHQKCTEHNCLYKKGGPGRPQSSGRNVEQVREAFLYSPLKSICRASQQPQVPPVTVWRVLKKHLHMKLCRLQLLQVLSDNDKEAGSTFYVDFLRLILDYENLMSEVVLSDRATFDVSDRLNTHNSLIFCLKNPRAFVSL